MKDLLLGVVFVGLFLVPFLPIYVENNFFFPFITGKNFAFRIIIEVVFASWVLLALYDPKYRPRFSWILAGFGALLGVMAVANALGESPLYSFWSNFERMEGYVTLVHVFLFVVVLGSVMQTEKMWWYFLNTSLAVAFLVAIFGLGQQLNVFEGGRGRVDSRLGNAAYMAIYMLFHIFFAYFLALRSKETWQRIGYIIVAAVLAYTLLQTGTRGTFLGLVGGSIVAGAYIALFAGQFSHLRRYALWGVGILVTLLAGFFILNQKGLIPESSPIARIANISLGRDLEVRTHIWAMALEGVKERPLLGWGQSNFNFVFNKEFDPALYAAESWFDRTHNIVFDWLIAGGILGLLAYFSIFFAALYYLFWQPMFSKEPPALNVLERGVLIGLLAGYLVHNLVVFDNIISYIFYGCVLALLHSQVSRKINVVDSFHIDKQLVTHFVAPIVVLVAGATVYFVNAPGIGAAGDIIDAMIAPTVTGRLVEFDSAIRRGSFADQEIVEQLAQQAMNIVRNPNVPEEEKQAMIMRAELELLRMIDEKPGDARLHTFLSSFYRSIGALPQAKEQSAKARELSPNKQSIILEQGIIELQLGNTAGAEAFLKTAFELDETNTQARVFYVGVLVGNKKFEEVDRLLTDEYFDQFAISDFAIAMVDQSGNRELLARMFESRITQRPTVAQERASLAFIYYERSDTEKAIEVLEAASNDIPDFSSKAQCLINNIKTGNAPEEGC